MLLHIILKWYNLTVETLIILSYKAPVPDHNLFTGNGNSKGQSADYLLSLQI